MSFHRILLTGICIITATTALADIDLSLYQNYWPSNYFQMSNARWTDHLPQQRDRITCNWDDRWDDGEKIHAKSLSEDLSDLIGPDDANGENLSKRWLLGSTGKKMLCASGPADASYYTQNNQSDLYNYLVENKVEVRYCGGAQVHTVDMIAKSTVPQPHLGDRTGYKQWKCDCSGDTCRWKRADAWRKCKPIDGGLKTGENRKNLLHFNNNIYLCGPSEDTVSASEYINNDSDSPLHITYRDGACDNGVEFAIMEPQEHLGDTVGDKIWRCERMGGKWQWTAMRWVPPCAADTIPESGLSDQIASDMFAHGPSGNYTKRIFVRRDGQLGDLQFAAMGYPWVGDADANDDTRLTDAGLCTTSICYSDQNNLVLTPNHNYSACVQRIRCERGGNDKYVIGSTAEWSCTEMTIPQESIREDLYQDGYTYLRNINDTKCDFTCTERGWVMQFNGRHGNPCKDDYVPSTDMRNCISVSELQKSLCEASGGELKNKGCKCDTSRRQYNDGYYTYTYCANNGQNFDPSAAVSDYEKSLVADISNATSNASTTAAGDNISTLAGRLALVEDQFGLSKWRTADGKFNTARLASDLTAGVVLGTTGALVTSSVVKKKQVKDGFESLECTVGGQHVGDWGDVFRIDGK